MNKPMDISKMPAELASVCKWIHRFSPPTEASPDEEVCVIYARYSGRNQKEASIERQDDLGKDYVAHMGYRLRAEYLFADRGRTGDSLDDRTALEEVRRLAREGAFKRILLYGWCRLSRRPGDAMMLFDEFEALGIEIHVCAGNTTGRINYFQALILSIFAMEERERLLRTTNYAAFAAAARGRNMGGIPYGFRKGDKRGELVVEEEEMLVIIRIFVLFVVDDVHPRKIAYILNKDGIPAPRGGLWTKEAIAGTPGRGGGILRSLKCVGYLVYGLTTIMRTPGRAKTTRTVGSLELLKCVEKPELARVDVDLFNEANAKLDAMGYCRGAQQERSSKSVLLLHGRYHCVCGSKMRLATAVGASGIRHLLCKAAFENGTCDRARSTSSHFVEAEVLREIRDRILSDDAVELFNTTYVAEMQSVRDEVLRSRKGRSARIAEIERWLDNSFLKSLNTGRTDEDTGRVCESLQAERRRLDEELADLVVPDEAMEVPNVDVHALRGAMDQLIMRTPLKNPTEADLKLVSALRKLVGKVVVDREQEREGYTLRIDASLADLSGRSGKSSPGAPGKNSSDVAVRTFVRDCPAPVRSRLRTPEFVRHLASKLESNEYCTSDEDWAAIEPLWVHWDHPRRRLILDATLFFLRSKTLGLRTLPAPFDGGYAIEYGVKQMIRKGCWASALVAMERIQSSTVAGLDTSRLASRVKCHERVP